MERNLRRWAFRVGTAIVAPVLLVLGAEGGLRLFGYGTPSDSAAGTFRIFVVGPFGPQTTLTPRASSLHRIPAGIAHKSTRVGQLLGRVLQAGARDSAPGEWRET
jgi:hypothetical protein